MAIDAIANIGDKSWTRHTYVLWFGAYGRTNVLVYADSLEDAIEEAAQCIHDKGWLGLFTEPDYAAALEDMCGDFQRTRYPREALSEEDMAPFAGMSSEEAWGIISRSEDLRYRIAEFAEADMTYTESGMIASWEWGLVAEDPTKEELLDIAHGGCTLSRVETIPAGLGGAWDTGLIIYARQMRHAGCHDHPMAKVRVRPEGIASA